MKKIIYLLCWILPATIPLQGQLTGPVKDSLWTTLTTLLNNPAHARDNTSADDQLKLLSGYRQKLAGTVDHHDSTYARLLHRISKLQEVKGDYVSAIRTIQQAISLITSNTGKPSVNAIHLIEYYLDLAYFYDALGLTAEKMKGLDSSIRIAQQLNHVNNDYLFALYQRAMYLFNIGDFARCKDYLAVGKSEAGRLPADIYEYKGIFRHREINAWIGLKDYVTTEKLVREAEADAKYMKDYTGDLYQQKAELEMSRNNYDKATEYYNRAITFLEGRATKNKLNCLQAHENLGYYVYYSYKHNYPKALQCYRKALAWQEKDRLPDPTYAVEILNLVTNMANVFVHLNRFDSAFYYYQYAFDQIKKGANENSLAAMSPDSLTNYNRLFYLTALFIDKADAYLLQHKKNNTPGSLAEAIRIYKVADRLLERVKAEQAELTSQLAWRQNARRLYEHAIEATYLSRDMANAFYFFEKSRAVLLNDQLTKFNRLNKTAVFNLAQLKRDIILLKNNLADTALPADKRSELEKKYIAVKQEADKLGESLKTTNPLYQQVSDTSFIKLHDVQTRLLKTHNLLLELFEGDSAVYALYITPGSTQLEKINKPTYDSLTNAYMAYLSDYSLLNNNYNNFISTSRSLYTLLFQKHAVPAGRIIISPDGHYLPFEALVTTATGNPTWFFTSYASSYTYSARYLLNNFSVTAGSDGSGAFLGVAPVQYATGLSMPALPGSDASLQQIGGSFNNARLLVQAQATRNNFIQLFSNYKIIQLYTHAAGNTVNNEPVIYFADSALYLSDLVSETKPIAQLVVLSACETGKGKLYSGEGVFSFNREFAAMGIPCSLVNLWMVNNQSTYKLTELFYKYLANGLPPDVALQKARMEFLQTASRENSMPYFWAATVVAGATNPVEFEKPSLWKYYIIVIVCLLAGLGIWTVYRKRNKK